jgi:hypothetical protein
MREAHAHAYRRETLLGPPDELTVQAWPEDADSLSLPEPDDLNAARGILFSCVIGAYLWLLIAIVAVRVF